MPTTTVVTLTLRFAQSIAGLADDLVVAPTAEAVTAAIRDEVQSNFEYDTHIRIETVEALGPAVETTEPDPPDYEVTSGGLNLVLIRPVSRAAHQWLADHVGAVETFAGRIAVEPRYLQALLDGLHEDGLRGVER